MRNAYVQFTLLVGFAVLDLLLWGFSADLSKSDWASWVQAVGSIAAILAAVAVVYFQIQETERIRHLEASRQVYRLLISLRTEVEIVNEKFITPIGKEIESLENDAPLQVKLHFIPEQFVVFDSHVENLGIIESDALRRLFIAAYAGFRGLLFAIEMNTTALNELDNEMFVSDEKIPEKRIAMYRKRLKTLGEQVRMRHAEAHRFIEQLQKVLDDDSLKRHFRLSDRSGWE